MSTKEQISDEVWKLGKKGVLEGLLRSGDFIPLLNTLEGYICTDQSTAPNHTTIRESVASLIGSLVRLLLQPVNIDALVASAINLLDRIISLVTRKKSKC